MKKNMRKYVLGVVVVLFWAANAHAGFSGVHGFAETDFGAVVSKDTPAAKHDEFNLLEERLQLKTTYYFEGNDYLSDKGGVINLKGDFVYDQYFDGTFEADLRELNLSFTPFDFMDVKAGRQVLTWGTGDYLFINDMFPKDYVSFFSGREDEYLKKPSDALKMSFYPAWANVDFIVMKFTPNTTAKGDRLSFFDSFQQGLAGTASDRDLLPPPAQLSNNEYAMRVYRRFGSNELAFYAFQGFDKNPTSYKDEANRQLYYRRLDSYGVSVRGPFGGGIGNAEAGYWLSRDDSDGHDRMIENSFFKALLGYDRDLGNDWKIGLQYFYEQRLDYDAYRNNLLSTDYRWDEFRHVVTNCLTKLFKNQTVMLSLFTFYSPSDKDGYVRPSASYDVTDQWKVTAGANLAWGEDDWTAFGQMKKNKNVYFRVKYSF